MSGVSLFDFLAMVIPGGLILAIVGNCLGYTPFVIESTEGNKFIVYTILLVASYLVGIVYNALMELIYDGFRNNPQCIADALRQVLCETSARYRVALKNMFGDWVLQTHIKHVKADGVLKNLYYEAYYYVANHSINSSITIMESQVAFMRNMLPPVLLSVLLWKDFFPWFGESWALCRTIGGMHIIVRCDESLLYNAVLFYVVNRNVACHASATI